MNFIHLKEEGTRKSKGRERTKQRQVKICKNTPTIQYDLHLRENELLAVLRHVIALIVPMYVISQEKQRQHVKH